MTTSMQNAQTLASVGQLLTRGYTIPCSAAAQAFTQLVQPTARFQLALDALFPLLDKPIEPAQRILVSFILYALYEPHPIEINPFQSVLFVTFVKEREHAVRVASQGGTSENEQFVWVLWKILKGDGNDIGPYSPNTLAHSPLPLSLRPTNLMLGDDEPEPRITPEQDEENARFSQAINLLLASRDRVLTLAEQRFLTPQLSALAQSGVVTSIDLPPIVASNPTVAYLYFVALLNNESENQEKYLAILTTLPPTLPTFDVIGKLLRSEDMSTATLVRTHVLNLFIHESIAHVDRLENKGYEYEVGVAALGRFLSSLIGLGIIGNNEADDEPILIEISEWALRNARFEEANGVYKKILDIGAVDVV